MADNQESGRENNNEENRFVNKFEKICAYLGPVIGMFVAAVGNFLESSDTIEQILNERWKRPDMIYSEEDGNEFYKCDIELKNGTLVLYPQFVITDGKRIIRMVHLDEFYPDPVLYYDSDINGFRVASGPWDSMAETFYGIKQELAELSETVEIHQVVLMELEYKNKKSDQFETIYYKMQDGQVYPVSENDIKRRGKDYKLNVNDPSDGLECITNDCEQLLKKQPTVRGAGGTNEIYTVNFGISDAGYKLSRMLPDLRLLSY